MNTTNYSIIALGNSYNFSKKEGCNSFIRGTNDNIIRFKLYKSSVDYTLKKIDLTIEQYVEFMNNFLKINIILENNDDNDYIFRLELKDYKNSAHRYYAFCILRHLYYYEDVIVKFFRYKTDDNNYNLSLLSLLGQSLGGHSFFNRFYNFNTLTLDEYLKKALENGNTWIHNIIYVCNQSDVKKSLDEIFNLNIKKYIEKTNNHVGINIIDNNHNSCRIIRNYQMIASRYIVDKKILNKDFNDNYVSTINPSVIETIKISDTLTISLYCQDLIANTRLVLKNNDKKQIIIKTNNDKITFDKKISSKYDEIIINLNRLKPEIISNDKNTKIINSNFHHYRTKTFLKNRLLNSPFSYVNKDKLKNEEMFYAVIINGTVVDSNYKNVNKLKDLTQVLKLEIFNVEFIEKNGDINIYSVNSKNLSNNKENIQKICVD